MNSMEGYKGMKVNVYSLLFDRFEIVKQFQFTSAVSKNGICIYYHVGIGWAHVRPGPTLAMPSALMQLHMMVDLFKLNAKFNTNDTREV